MNMRTVFQILLQVMLLGSVIVACGKEKSEEAPVKRFGSKDGIGAASAVNADGSLVLKDYTDNVEYKFSNLKTNEANSQVLVQLDFSINQETKAISMVIDRNQQAQNSYDYYDPASSTANTNANAWDSGNSVPAELQWGYAFFMARCIGSPCKTLYLNIVVYAKDAQGKYTYAPRQIGQFFDLQNNSSFQWSSNKGEPIKMMSDLVHTVDTEYDRLLTVQQN